MYFKNVTVTDISDNPDAILKLPRFSCFLELIVCNKYNCKYLFPFVYCVLPSKTLKRVMQVPSGGYLSGSHIRCTSCMRGWELMLNSAISFKKGRSRLSDSPYLIIDLGHEC